MSIFKPTLGCMLWHGAVVLSKILTCESVMVIICIEDRDVYYYFIIFVDVINLFSMVNFYTKGLLCILSLNCRGIKLFTYHYRPNLTKIIIQCVYQAWEFSENFLISRNCVPHSVDFQDVLRHLCPFLHFQGISGRFILICGLTQTLLIISFYLSIL